MICQRSLLMIVTNLVFTSFAIDVYMYTDCKARLCSMILNVISYIINNIIAMLCPANCYYIINNHNNVTDLGTGRYMTFGVFIYRVGGV